MKTGASYLMVKVVSGQICHRVFRITTTAELLCSFHQSSLLGSTIQATSDEWGLPTTAWQDVSQFAGYPIKVQKRKIKKENGGLKRNSRLLHVLEHRRSAAGTESLGTKAENRSVSRLFLTHSALCDAALCRSDTGLLPLAAGRNMCCV